MLLCACSLKGFTNIHDFSFSSLQNQVVAIPQDFITAAILTPSDRSTFRLTCQVEANDMRFVHAIVLEAL